MMVVPFMDAIAKHLSASYDLVQIVWARYFFHFFLIAPLVLWRFGWRGLTPPRLAAQILRGGLLLGSTMLFFAAIALMPLADALALVFVAPLIVTALSPWILGEKVGPRRYTAVALGFLGVLIIIRPGAGVFDLGALLALCAGSALRLLPRPGHPRLHGASGRADHDRAAALPLANARSRGFCPYGFYGTDRGNRPSLRHPCLRMGRSVAAGAL
jgi:hypothetical protein